MNLINFKKCIIIILYYCVKITQWLLVNNSKLYNYKAILYSWVNKNEKSYQINHKMHL